jgi:hypothetical protein
VSRLAAIRQLDQLAVPGRDSDFAREGNAFRVEQLRRRAHRRTDRRLEQRVVWQFKEIGDRQCKRQHAIDRNPLIARERDFRAHDAGQCSVVSEIFRNCPRYVNQP